MDKFEQRNVVIKRVKKGHEAHHGGAWKVAMADFAMAMMALFLILWLINSSNEEEIAKVAGYFQDPQSAEDGNKVPSPWVIDLGGSPAVQDNVAESQTIDPTKILQAEQIESAAEAIERARLETMEAEFKQQIDASSTLSPYRDQIKVDITSEGVRIQIVDKTNRPMFDPGSARLKYYAEDILYEMAPIFSAVPNRISITGHTDSSGRKSAWATGNWELSASRANAARRALGDAGLEEAKIAQVVGMGDKAHFNITEPESAINRRIAIVVLNKRTDNAIASRAGGYIEEGSQGEADVEREGAVKQSGSILDDLQRQRDDESNQYDAPPDVEDEAFW
ncbi:MAG: flagellar motor protein MotB [Bermanella sp.]